MTEADRQVAGRYTVQSVARALRLVEIVAGGPPDGLSLSELARTLGTSKSSTLALARTLVAFGYLRDAHPGPGYTLGTGLIRLGDIVGRQLPLGDLCRPLIEGLSRETKLTSRVAISDDGYPVFLDRVDGPGSVRFHTPLGQRELPYASAAGKAILSAMDADGIRRMCAGPGWPPGPRTPSPTSTRCWIAWPWPGGSASPSTTRRTRRVSSAWARRSSATMAPASGRSA